MFQISRSTFRGGVAAFGLLAALLADCTVVGEVLVEDSFDGYPVGEFAGSAVGELRWNAREGGVHEIVPGSKVGRPGQVYFYRSLEGTEASVLQTSLKLSPEVAARVARGRWTIALDFYVETLSEKATILSVYAPRGKRLFYVTLVPHDRGGNIRVLAGIGGETEGRTTSPIVTGEHPLQRLQWYTLTVSGDSDSRKVAFEIAGEDFHAVLREKEFEWTDGRGAVAPDSIWLGIRSQSRTAHGSKGLYFDNFSLSKD